MNEEKSSAPPGASGSDREKETSAADRMVQIAEELREVLLRAEYADNLRREADARIEEETRAADAKQAERVTAADEHRRFLIDLQQRQTIAFERIAATMERWDLDGFPVRVPRG